MITNMYFNDPVVFHEEEELIFFEAMLIKLIIKKEGRYYPKIERELLDANITRLREITTKLRTTVTILQERPGNLAILKK